MIPRPAGELRIEGLTKRYAGQPAVSDFTATMRSGQFFSLLGPSGSGKTTTLMMIAGFTEPDGGSIRLDGEDITRLGPQQRVSFREIEWVQLPFVRDQIVLEVWSPLAS